MDSSTRIMGTNVSCKPENPPQAGFWTRTAMLQPNQELKSLEPQALGLRQGSKVEPDFSAHRREVITS